MRAAIGIMALAAAVAACSSAGSVTCEFRMGPVNSDGMPARDGMPDLGMRVGDTVETPLADHFRPHFCVEGMGDDIWYLQSADPSAVAVSVSEDTLTTVAVAVADSVRVIVGVGPFGANHPDPFLQHEFLVRVRPAGR